MGDFACVCVCVCLPKFVLFRMLVCGCMSCLLAHTYMRIFAHIVTCILTYMHILPLAVVEKG